MVFQVIVFTILLCCFNFKFIYCLECDGKGSAMEICDDPSLPVTLDTIKLRLRETGIFDWNDPTLLQSERKELASLQDTLDIVTSRNRQPSNVQNLHASLALVKNVVNEKLKSGKISKGLAKRFNWKKLAESKSE